MKKILLVLLALLVTFTSVAFANVEATGEGPSKEQALVTAMSAWPS